MPEQQTQSQSQSQNESQSHSHGQSATASIADGVAWAHQSSSGGLTDGEAAQLSSLLAASHANTDATSRHEGLTSAEAQQLDSLTALAYGTSGEAKSGDATTENGTSFSGAVGFSTGGSDTWETTDSHGQSNSSGISEGESAGIFSSEALQAGIAQRIGEAESLSAELAVATTYGSAAEALANMHSPSPELVSRLEGLSGSATDSHGVSSGASFEGSGSNVVTSSLSGQTSDGASTSGSSSHTSSIGTSESYPTLQAGETNTAFSHEGASTSGSGSDTRSIGTTSSDTLGGASSDMNGAHAATSTGHGHSVSSSTTATIGEARDSTFGDAVSTSGSSSNGSTDSTSSSRGDSMTHGEGSQNPAFSEGGSFTAALNAGSSDSHAASDAMSKVSEHTNSPELTAALNNLVDESNHSSQASQDTHSDAVDVHHHADIDDPD